MAQSIWEIFSLTIRGNSHDTNFLGLDLGDGEYAMSHAFVDANNRIRVKGLYVDTGGILLKSATALWINENGPNIVGDPAIHEYLINQNGVLYSNFKRPPGGKAIRQRYGMRMDEGTPRYGDLMRICFQEIVNQFFKNNHELYEKKKTIIFVGRPASGGWRESEVDYRNLLQRGLQIDGYNGKVEVVVLSESLAGLAYETMPDHRSIRKGDIAVIIDCGSSTFDASLVLGDHIPEHGEYSRQVGGGMIEQNMLTLFMKEAKGKEPLYQHDTLQLRRHKERYYGDNGVNGHVSQMQKEIYYVDLIDGEMIAKKIDNTMMHEAVHSIPVHMSGTTHSDQGTSYASWYQACVAFFKGVVDMLHRCGVYTPNDGPGHRPVLGHVILTGGVSVMPEIKELAETMLGCKPRSADRPNYSVSDGLAYMGLVEFLKQQELINLESQVASIVDAAPSVSGYVADDARDYNWKEILRSLDLWLDGQNSSIRDWFQGLLWMGIPSHILKSSIQRWYDENIHSNIQAAINAHFNVLFPNFADRYQFQINLDMVSAIWDNQKPIGFVFSLWGLQGFWRALFGPTWDRKLDKPHRIQVANNIKNNKDKICQNIRSQIIEELRIEASTRSALKEAIMPQLVVYVDGMTVYFIQSGRG